MERILDDAIKEKEIETDKRIENFFEEENSNCEKIPGKHFKHMTREEITYLLTLKSIALRKKITFSSHSIDRMRDRRIKKKEVINALRTGQIIDYRKIEDSEILTIRGCYLRRDEQVYVVFVVNTGKVITTYTNRHFAAKYKMSHLERYEENYNIEIPKDFGSVLNFYHI